MSHWSNCKVQIHDVQLLKQLAEQMGCVVELGDQVVDGYYAGEVKAAGVIRASEGDTRNVAAIIADSEGGYGIQMDNYHNSITRKIGDSASALCQKYTASLIRREAVNAGYVVTGEHQDENGEIVLKVAVM